MARGDIVRVRLPQPARHPGHEQIGIRPALVVHDDATCETLSVIMIVPFTGQISAQRFPYTLRVNPSLTNGLSTPSVLLIFQLRAIDRSRIEGTIGQLEPETMELVNTEMQRLLGL